MLNPDQIKSGQGPRLAFLEKPDPQQLAEILVAFANTEGGTIMLGLTAEGKPASLTFEPADVQSVLKKAEDLYNPAVVIDKWEEIQINELGEELDEVLDGLDEDDDSSSEYGVELDDDEEE